MIVLSLQGNSRPACFGNGNRVTKLLQSRHGGFSVVTRQGVTKAKRVTKQGLKSQKTVVAGVLAVTGFIVTGVVTDTTHDTRATQKMRGLFVMGGVTEPEPLQLPSHLYYIILFNPLLPVTRQWGGAKLSLYDS